ncbi:MAG: hypothetical protein ACRCTE_08840 [Cellulosilyticaceae bacterium]
MYCVIGSKILWCEVREKCSTYSWCQIGDAVQNKSIPHNKLFKTQEEASAYIEQRDQKKAAFVQDISTEVDKCNALYDAFLQETGICVRVIDRKWSSVEVSKQLAKLRKKHK